MVLLCLLDPEFLTRERGLNLAGIAAVAWIPFLVADLSNFSGGYLTLLLQRAGWSVNRTRKTLMVLATVLSPVGILAVFAHSLFWTIALISVAIYFWMFWSITIHSLPGDLFPPRAVASVYGIGGTGSTIGSVMQLLLELLRAAFSEAAVQFLDGKTDTLVATTKVQ